jgi:hypothetical protein
VGPGVQLHSHSPCVTFQLPFCTQGRNKSTLRRGHLTGVPKKMVSLEITPPLFHW